MLNLNEAQRVIEKSGQRNMSYSAKVIVLDIVAHVTRAASCPGALSVPDVRRGGCCGRGHRVLREDRLGRLLQAGERPSRIRVWCAPPQCGNRQLKQWVRRSLIGEPSFYKNEI